MNWRAATALAAAWLALLPARPMAAQFAQDRETPRSMLEETELRSERKRHSMFHRPARETAAEQFERAASLARLGKSRAAMKAYNALVHEWGTAPEAPKAQYEYARLLEERADYDKAFDEYQYLIDFYAGQFQFEEVIDRQFRIANCLMTEKRMRFLFGGFRSPSRALPKLEKIAENAPNWKKSGDVEFLVGVINEDAKEYEAASHAYETARMRYRRGDKAVESSYRRAHCLCLLAKAAPRDETACRDALSALTMFVRDYPDDKNASDAQSCLDELKEKLADMYFERALFYDKIAKRPASAAIAYTDFVRNFPTSEKAGDASRRIDELSNVSKGDKAGRGDGEEK